MSLLSVNHSKSSILSRFPSFFFVRFGFGSSSKQKQGPTISISFSGHHQVYSNSSIKFSTSSKKRTLLSSLLSAGSTFTSAVVSSHSIQRVKSSRLIKDQTFHSEIPNFPFRLHSLNFASVGKTSVNSFLLLHILSFLPSPSRLLNSPSLLFFSLGLLFLCYPFTFESRIYKL